MNHNRAREVRWICVDCALNHGGKLIPEHLATYHHGECGVCRTMKTVTGPRDYDWRHE